MVMMILITSYLLDLCKWADLLSKCSLADLVQLASGLQYLDWLQPFFSKAKGRGHSVRDTAVLGCREQYRWKETEYPWLDGTVGVAPPETSCSHGCELRDMVTGLVHRTKSFTFSDCLQYQPFICSLWFHEAHKIVLEYKDIISKYALIRGPWWSWCERQVHGMSSF